MRDRWAVVSIALSLCISPAGPIPSVADLSASWASYATSGPRGDLGAIGGKVSTAPRSADVGPLSGGPSRRPDPRGRQAAHGLDCSPLGSTLATLVQAGVTIEARR
jgi:hypothetical protein